RERPGGDDPRGGWGQRRDRRRDDRLLGPDAAVRDHERPDDRDRGQPADHPQHGPGRRESGARDPPPLLRPPPHSPPPSPRGPTASGGSGSVVVGEGTLVLGNANALGTTTFNLVPGTFPSVIVQKGATLDLTALSAAPVRINTVFGAGAIALGNSQLNTGNSS